MALLRAAFECDNGTTQIVVLCAGCYSDVALKSGKRRWSRAMTHGYCEFCCSGDEASALR